MSCTLIFIASFCIKTQFAKVSTGYRECYNFIVQLGVKQCIDLMASPVAKALKINRLL